MKNFVKFGLFLLIAFLAIGCGAKEQKLLCTLESKDVANGYSLKSTYEVNGKGGVAEKTHSVEVVTSDNDAVLSYFEKTLNDTYKKYNDNYGGYNYKISKESNKVTSDTTIDYEKLNLAAFVKDQPSLKKYTTKGNKLKLEGIKVMYETLGAKCELK